MPIKPVDFTSAIYGGLEKGLILSLIAFWPYFLILGLIFITRIIFTRQRRMRLAEAGFTEIDKMTGIEFEDFLLSLFTRLGYQGKTTKVFGDFGGDLVINKNGVKTVVQAKRWSKKTGVKAVQEVVAAKGYYGASEAIVVASHGFTQQAYELARANKVELWDRERLAQKLLESRRNISVTQESIDIPEVSSVSNTSQRLCATCGKEVSTAVADFCMAHPNRFQGQIYCYNHQRSVVTR